MATRSLGTLTIDILARTANLTQGMSKAAREVDNEAKRIRRSLESNVAQGANTASDALNRFGAQVVSIAAAWRGLSAGIAAADTWTNLNNRLRLVTDGQDQFVAAQENVLRIAKESRQPLEATAELYQRIATNQKELGLSGQGVADIVETISKAMVVSGTSAQGAQAALVQLGQAFASGTLRGEELNSVLEQAPALANAIAAGLGVPIGKLRELGKEGKLTAEQVIGALQDQADEIDSAFGSMDATVSQALTNVRTNLTEIIGRFSDATGAASGLASAITLLGNNLPQVAAAFAAFASVKLTQQLGDRVRVFRETQAALVAQTKTELANAQAIELKTRAALLDAQTEVRRAQAIGGSVAISAKAAQATLAHRQAVLALEAAQTRAAAAANVWGRAAGSLLGFFGGPAGIAVMLATTAASWLLFRDNTDKSTQALIDFNGTADESIRKFEELNRAQQAGEMLRLSDEIAEGAKSIGESIALLSNEADFTDLYDTFGESLRKLQREFDSGKIGADEFANAVSDLGNKLIDTGQVEEAQRRGIINYAAAIGNAAREVERKNQILDAFAGKQRDAANAVDGNTKAIRDQAAALAEGQKALSDYIGKLDEKINKGAVDLIRKTRGEFAALQVEVGQMINAAGGVDALDPKQREAINRYLAIRREQIRAEEAYDKAKKAAREGKRDAAKEARDADRIAKATEAMARAQRDWTTELSGTGNSIMDDYARRLDDIKDKVEQFTRVGVPADKIAEFNVEMEKLAAGIRDKELADFAREFNWSTEELELSLSGTSSAAVQYERALYELDQQLKQNLITQEQYDRRLAGLQSQRFSAPESLLKDLQFELELMRMTNAERATAIQLRGMEAEAVKKYGDQIRELNRQIQEDMEKAAFFDGIRGEFSDFITDVVTGTESIKDAFKSMLDNIAAMITQRISKNWVEQLFGDFGTTQTGSAGGWLSAIADLFAGRRATGGWIGAGKFAEVNERGIEMATVRGRDYLLTGGAPVEITPNHRIGVGSGGNITQNFYNPVMSNIQTDQQRAREEARKAQRATARLA